MQMHAQCNSLQQTMTCALSVDGNRPPAFVAVMVSHLGRQQQGQRSAIAPAAYLQESC